VPERRAHGLFVGLATLDIVSRVDRIPAANEKLTAESQFVAAGGPAANAAVTFAALGGTATLVTALGSSTVAQAIVADLRACGVRVVDVAPDLGAASVSSVLVTRSTGDRAVVGGDARGVLVSAPASEAVSELVEESDVLLLDGHHAAMAAAFAAAAQTAAVPVVVDAGRWKPAFADLLPHATEVVASADFRMPGHESGAAVAEHLVAEGVPVVVRTAGAGPVRWRTATGSGEVVTPAVAAVDTLGAGDVFHGAYAYAVANGVDDVASRVSYASEVASVRCTMIGPRSWLGAIATTSLSQGDA